MTIEESNQLLIEKFYLAFAAKDVYGMLECYHADVEFEDPAFGKLTSNETRGMWQMLVSRGKDLKVVFSNVNANETNGSAHWVATYTFSATGKKVVNRINAHFEFKDNKIFRHSDSFDLNKWFLQAFGWKGYFFIVLPFLRKAFKTKARQQVEAYGKKNNIL
jgi:ketosteroid isomerase-like protein